MAGETEHVHEVVWLARLSMSMRWCGMNMSMRLFHEVVPLASIYVAISVAIKQLASSNTLDMSMN